MMRSKEHRQQQRATASCLPLLVGPLPFRSRTKRIVENGSPMAREIAGEARENLRGCSTELQASRISQEGGRVGRWRIWRTKDSPPGAKFRRGGVPHKVLTRKEFSSYCSSHGQSGYEWMNRGDFVWKRRWHARRGPAPLRLMSHLQQDGGHFFPPHRPKQAVQH